MTQLQGLVRRFPSKYVKEKPGGRGGSYVSHEVVNQRLLHIVGPFSTHVVEVIRDIDGTVTGVLLSLTVEVDGREVTVTEVGDCEQPGNWKHDGARLKDAMSDAIKRCAMRLGVGIHLWAQDLFYLDQALDGSES